ncbi:hypothetical protein [Pontibacter liquoris]|uniref:hypothetical protein n=1 Tax=Pontibacter liquoris TaxID=2905677 RepID=UPI001FA6E258|nr:hypothetical protein [Pontibacter liquoris]
MKALFLPLFLVLFSTAVMAQGTPKEGSPAATALSNQFNKLKSNSNSYQENNREYKVVNVEALNAFWTNVQATLAEREKKLLNASKDTREELAQAQATIAQQKKQLQALRADNVKKDQEVQKSASAIANISVLGLDMPKQFYVILTGIIIIALLVVLAVVMAVYRKSKIVTDEKQRAYNEMEAELNESKKNAREKELKLKRDLQTEMNRVEELNKEIASLQRQHH